MILRPKRKEGRINGVDKNYDTTVATATGHARHPHLDDGFETTEVKHVATWEPSVRSWSLKE